MLLAEHAGSGKLEENLHPAGRFFYAASALVCVPNALSDEHAEEPLGSIPGEQSLRRVASAAGFSTGAPCRGRRAPQPGAGAAPLDRFEGWITEIFPGDDSTVKEPSSLVGRGPVLAGLREALDAALAGHGSLALITGEPGVGKTALVTAFADEAAARGVRMAWSRCAEGEGVPGFWPWTQVLRATEGCPTGRITSPRPLPG